MRRTCVVTGSAAGIGKATVERFRAQGNRVIGVDLHDAEVIADLTTRSGRESMINEVAAITGGAIDVVIANAGIASSSPQTIQLCYFGAVATLDGLRPFMASSTAPRAAAVASIGATTTPVDDRLVRACLSGNEAEATTGNLERAYPSSKRALVRWIRRVAPSNDWAGAGIPLNAVAPGIIRTQLSNQLLETQRGRLVMELLAPRPLGEGEPDDVAALLDWLTSPENRIVTGQLIAIDGGAECIRRGDDVWVSPPLPTDLAADGASNQ